MITTLGLEQNLHGKFTYPCSHPWNELSISSEGKASLCCLDYDYKVVVGDFNTSSIKEIWNGQPIKNCRKLLTDLAYDKIEICKNCNNYLFQDKEAWAYIMRSN